MSGSRFLYRVRRVRVGPTCDVLELRCGHVINKPRKSGVGPRIWVKAVCTFCQELYADFERRSEAGKRRNNNLREALAHERQDPQAQPLTTRVVIRRAAQPQGAEDDMAKKKTTKGAKLFKAKAKKDVTAPARAWAQTYEFVKPLKVEPIRETIMGSVYAAISKAKGALTVDQVTEKAVANGLQDYSDQNPRTQTQVMLRRLAAAGSVRILRATAGGDPKPVKKAKAEATPTAPAKKAKPAGKAGKGATKATKGEAKAKRRVVVAKEASNVATADAAAADV